MKNKNNSGMHSGVLGVLTPDDLEAQIGMKKGTQANRRSAGTLPYSKIGRKIVYLVSDIQEIINRHRVNGVEGGIVDVNSGASCRA